MWDKNKVMKLNLGASRTTVEQCSTRMGVNSAYCQATPCRVCTQRYKEKHAETVVMDEDFRCNNCLKTTEELGLGELDCSECVKHIEEYVRQDFKSIFDGLGDKNV